MQIRRCPIPRNLDIVPAYFLRFIVQGLRDVAEEMDEEFEGLFFVGGAEGRVLDALGVVGYRAHDAAACAAVAGGGDGAGRWRAVFGVDEAGEREKHEHQAVDIH